MPGFTVRFEVPTTSVPSCALAVAVMTVTQLVVPQFTAVASPDELIVAMSTALDAQVTVSVMSTVVGLAE